MAGGVNSPRERVKLDGGRAGNWRPRETKGRPETLPLVSRWRTKAPGAKGEEPGVGEREGCPQNLYSLLPARMAMVKNVLIARLDLREEETQTLSPALPPSCSSGPAAPSWASLSLQVPSMLSRDGLDSIEALVPAAPGL